MIPDLSPIAVVGDYLVPDNREVPPLEDYEIGGVAIQNPSQGLRVKVWHGFMVDGWITLEAPGVPATPIYTEPNIIEFSFTFDQNMNTFITFLVKAPEDDVATAKFRWFDSTILDYTVTTLDGYVESPRCSLDDKRPESLGISDVLLAYVKNDNLYIRAQRDRYTVEYLLKENVGATIHKFGMANKLRMQFKMKTKVQ